MKSVKKFFEKFKRMDLFSWILYLVVIAWVASMIFMLYLAFANSLKHYYDFCGFEESKGTVKYVANVFGLPRPAGNGMFSRHLGWQWKNYANIFTPVVKDFNTDSTLDNWNFFSEEIPGVGYIDIYGYYLNSVIYAVAMTVFSLATEIMVAYCCAKYDFKLGKVYYAVAIVVMIVPIVGSLASELSFANALFGLKDNVIGICILKCKYPGLYFLVFYATFKNVSSTYMEAAELDGAGHFQIFWQIMFPLIRASTFAVFILLFITNWNDYYTPMVFLRDMPVISLRLYELQFRLISANSMKMFAACICSALPIIVLFVAFRNKIMGNVTMGGIKG
ncbi:MAG: carbohydrate ABC transporter permease [Clostridiales bacterium]|nr:carbohydrate ABC transporter permease [Clostridiales bacterium]